jgi:CRP-like cAMP-binding protein
MSSTTLPHRTDQVSVPRQPVEDFLRHSIAGFDELLLSEESDDRIKLIASLRHRHRSHLAAFLLLSDSAHDAKVTDLMGRIERGEDLGPSLSLEEFDAKYPEAAE